MTNKGLRVQKDLKGEIIYLKFNFIRGGDNRQKGPNAKAELHVTLEDLFLGTTRDMTVNRNVYCPKCRGTGAKDGKTKKCPKCKG